MIPPQVHREPTAPFRQAYDRTLKFLPENDLQEITVYDLKAPKIPSVLLTGQ